MTTPTHTNHTPPKSLDVFQKFHTKVGEDTGNANMDSRFKVLLGSFAIGAAALVGANVAQGVPCSTPGAGKVTGSTHIGNSSGRPVGGAKVQVKREADKPQPHSPQPLSDARLSAPEGNIVFNKQTWTLGAIDYAANGEGESRVVTRKPQVTVSGGGRTYIAVGYNSALGRAVLRDVTGNGLMPKNVENMRGLTERNQQSGGLTVESPELAKWITANKDAIVVAPDAATPAQLKALERAGASAGTKASAAAAAAPTKAVIQAAPVAELAAAVSLPKSPDRIYSEMNGSARVNYYPDLIKVNGNSVAVIAVKNAQNPALPGAWMAIIPNSKALQGYVSTVSLQPDADSLAQGRFALTAHDHAAVGRALQAPERYTTLFRSPRTAELTQPKTKAPVPATVTTASLSPRFAKSFGSGE